MKPEAEILIVDDEVNIRSALVTILEKCGRYWERGLLILS